MKEKQLTWEQRYQLESLLQVDTPKKRIAELIDTSLSSVYREIKRNSNKRSYRAAYAQQLCDERKERFGRNRKFTPVMERHIRKKLVEEQWSPEQIVGHARLTNMPMVSVERIYQFIRDDKAKGGNLWKHTRHKLKHRKRPVSGKQISIKNRVSIDRRPDIVDTKQRLGDWEIDTIIGKDGKGAILTMTERKTGFLLMEKLEHGKQADALSKTVIRLLYAYKKDTHTITSDNGTEFACHELIAKKLQLDFFFAHPYSSWERGLNEYTNGLIRQYIPKGTDFKEYSNEFVKRVQHKINSRPRKKLGYHTPVKKIFASLR
jgi:IS30 family transposase